MVKVRLLELREEFREYGTRPLMGAPEKVYVLVKPMMPEDREQFMLLSLNTKNGVMAVRMISVGSLNANIVHPREVFKAAILDSAAHVNHSMLKLELLTTVLKRGLVTQRIRKQER